MTSTHWHIPLLLTALLIVTVISQPKAPRIAVANKVIGGDFLLIESDNEEAQISVLLAADSTPMYVSLALLSDEIWVGDRNNNQFYVYDAVTLRQTDIVNGCNGIFHQFYNFLEQMWIVCDIDMSVLVFDARTRTLAATIAIATDKDANDDNYKPHDITSHLGYTFVSLMGGIIIQFSAQTFSELNRIQIGADPHLFINDFDPQQCCLYVTSSDANLVYKIDIHSLNILATISVNAAHGIWGTTQHLYVADIASPDGKASLHVIDYEAFEFIAGSPFDAMAGNPHNLMVNWCESNRLYITHSLQGIVSAYDIKQNGQLGHGRIIFSDSSSVPFGVMSIPDVGGCDEKKDKDDKGSNKGNNKGNWKQ